MGMLQLKIGALYFLVVFAVGFILGVVRIMFLVPILGQRYAELAEMPVMLMVVFLTAYVLVRKYGHRLSGDATLGFGFVAVVMLIIVEFTVVLGLRGLSLAEYVEGRDPVASFVYAASLLVFALAPWLVSWYLRLPLNDRAKRSRNE